MILLARPRQSLRHWLLTASVTAVLAGYGVLLLTYGWLSALDRREAHTQLVTRVEALALRGELLPSAFFGSDVVAWIAVDAAAPAPSPPPPLPANWPQIASIGHQPKTLNVVEAWSAGGHTYLSSVRPLLRNGTRFNLYVLKDVTIEIQRQRRNSMVLLAFAGISTLVTAALLRPVLNAGLRPLELLGDWMAQLEADHLQHHRLPLAPQPQELQRIAAAFNDLLERLAVSWERQRVFVNGVSHELRTPITLVAGYAGRLRRRGGNLTPSERQQLLLIEEEAARMGRMVADLLDIARSDAGQLCLQRQPFSVEECCLQVIERLRPVAGPRLQLAPACCDGPFPAQALGDLERFEQCLLNLVENALKYSPPTSLVTLAWESRGATVVVHVLDQGPGVAPADRARLLQPFQRGRQLGDTPGSGIGLAVVDTLMQAMGGAVLIGAAATGGADFQLILPVVAPSPAPIKGLQPSTGPAAPAGRS